MRIEYADRRRTTPRKEAMLARRIRQRTRKVSFTPVPNARVDARIKATQGVLTLAYVKRGGEMPSGAQIEAEARRKVTATLPAIPIGVRIRGYQSRSKYNQANTRGKR